MKEPCGVCDGLSKYRCPSCEVVYCSLACYKIHKEELCSVNKRTAGCNRIGNEAKQEAHDLEHCGSTEREEGELSDTDSNDICDSLTEMEDLVPKECLRKLMRSEHLRNLLCNKHLRDLLLHIVNSQTAAQTIGDFMQIPLFVEFANECLAVVHPDL